MARVREVTVEVGRTVAANYCSRSVRLGAVLVVEEGEDTQEVCQRWSARLQAEVDARLAAMLEA